MNNHNNLSSKPNSLANPGEVVLPRGEARAIGRQTLDFTNRLAQLQAAQKQMEASYAKVFQGFDNAQTKALKTHRETIEAIEHNRI